MEKGYLEQLVGKIRNYLVFWLIIAGLVLVVVTSLLDANFDLNDGVMFGILAVFWVLLSVFFAIVFTKRTTEPFIYLVKSILHISPQETLVSAPNLQELKLGRELITNLVRQVYEFASSDKNISPPVGAGAKSDVLQQIPIPLIGLDEKQNIVFANKQAERYLSPQSSLVGQNVFMALDLSFQGDKTLKQWIGLAQSQKVTFETSWSGVKLRLPSGDSKYFDLTATFSKHNPSGVEVLLALFDRSANYAADDKAISFIALAVHELRTPLTVLRGYIEVFEEELAGKLDAEMTDFMQKMQVAAESLTAFVNNILNVAKAEENQLTLKLVGANWNELLKRVVDTMQLRATVYGKTIELQIAPDLPEVAVDTVSISEVLNNLLDNAIKYSPEGPSKIMISSKLGTDGLVETTVQDFGVGIASSAMPHLFEKFYRNHRTKTQIGGSGLGLYLSKTIVTALGGNIWVRSKEGQGSTFGFSILPYAKLTEEQKRNDTSGIIRTKHGWIKNHSLQRR